LFEITPGSNPNIPTKSSSKAAVGADFSSAVIRPSRMLFLLESSLYSAGALSACIALIPLSFRQFYWSIFLLLFLTALGVIVCRRWHARNDAHVTLRVHAGQWYLEREKNECKVKPIADILLWSQIVVIPLQDIASHKKYCIIALQDSMSEDDWRRLRVWLRIGLRRI